MIAWLLMAGKWAWKLARAIPWQIYAALAVLLALWWFGHVRYEAGETAADTRRDIADRLAAEARARRAVQVVTKQAEVTTRIVTEYVDRVKVVREKGREILKEVPVYVPADSCPLPAGFRVLHDAAAGLSPIPNPSARTDAAPVPAQAAAATVADNYGTCRETAEQLTSLQAWVRAQKGVSSASDH